MTKIVLAVFGSETIEALLPLINLLIGVILGLLVAHSA